VARDGVAALQIHEKEERKAALEAEYDKLPKNIERELFISRIMDIIKNIKKQQVDSIVMRPSPRPAFPRRCIG
jgi:polyribonucleotide nucleotidyltransferase